MWRILKFCYIFQISSHLPCIEIWNFSTWQIFLHMSHMWILWQIWGMGKTLTFEAMLLPSLLPVAAPSQVRQIRWISIAHQVRRGPNPGCRGRIITITCDGWIPKHSSSLHHSSSFTISKFEKWKWVPCKMIEEYLNLLNVDDDSGGGGAAKRGSCYCASSWSAWEDAKITGFQNKPSFSFIF